MYVYGAMLVGILYKSSIDGWCWRACGPKNNSNDVCAQRTECDKGRYSCINHCLDYHTKQILWELCRRRYTFVHGLPMALLRPGYIVANMWNDNVNETISPHKNIHALFSAFLYHSLSLVLFLLRAWGRFLTLFFFCSSCCCYPCFWCYCHYTAPFCMTSIWVCDKCKSCSAHA